MGSTFQVKSLYNAPAPVWGIGGTEKKSLLTLARACAAKGYCSRSVGRSVGLSVCVCVCVCVSVPTFFSRTVAAVDTKRGYVGTVRVKKNLPYVYTCTQPAS